MAEIWNNIVSGQYMGAYLTDSLISLLMVLCFFDVLLGILVAIRTGTINSTIGLNGIVRKCVIIASLLFLHMVDILCKINLISIFPEAVRQWLENTFNINNIGVAGLFGIYIIIFELLSILKNWEQATNIRLPSKIKKMLGKISSELQDDEGEETFIEDIEENFKLHTKNDIIPTEKESQEVDDNENQEK